MLCACNASTTLLRPPGDARDPVTSGLRTKITTIVVIYAENRAFDNLYGNFSGAIGVGQVLDAAGHPLPGYIPQVDRNGSVLPSLPQSWGGVTAAGYTPVITQAQSAGLPNAPFAIERAFSMQSGITLSSSAVTRDLDRKSTRLNSSHTIQSRMPSSA